MSNLMLWALFLTVGIVVGAIVVQYLPYIVFFVFPNARQNLLQADTESAALMRRAIGAILGGVLAVRHLLSVEREKR